MTAVLFCLPINWCGWFLIMPQRQGTIIRRIMRTEIANLPGKFLHKHCCQFKLSVGKYSVRFFFFNFYCYVHMATSTEILVVQATLNHGMLCGQYSKWLDFQHLVAVKCEQLLSTSVFPGILLIMLYINEQWKQSVKPVNIYMLHYQAAWPRSHMHACRHICIHTDVCTNTLTCTWSNKAPELLVKMGRWLTDWVDWALEAFCQPYS